MVYQDVITLTATAPTLAQQFVPTALANYPANVNTSDPTYPYPVWVLGTQILRQPALPVPVPTPLIQEQELALMGWSTGTIYNLAQVLASTLFLQGGLSISGGLAAPQAGLSWRMFVVSNPVLNFTGSTFQLQSTPSVQGGDYQIFINPAVTPSATNKTTWPSTEDCMSIPGFIHQIADQADVRPIRYKQFTIAYHTLSFDKSGNPTLVSASYNNTYSGGSNSANDHANWVLQHETDHLDGILFIDGIPGIYTSNEILGIEQGQQGGLYNPTGNYPPAQPD